MLRSLVKTVPAEEGTGRNSRITFCYTPSKAYPVYRLPQTTLFTQLTSFVEPSLHVFATFYGGRLLLAPDEDSLSRYIRHLDNDEVLDGALAYRAGTDGLSDSYHFMLMADLDTYSNSPDIRFIMYRNSFSATPNFSVISFFLRSLLVRTGWFIPTLF